MKTAFLYAGQGSQKVGMGKDFYENYPEYRAFVDSLNLPFDVKRLMHEGPLEELSQTQYTQACMATFAAGVTMLLAKEGIKPDAACGLSLGEYGALYAAEVMDANTYVELTAFRGNAMMEAAKGCKCCMSAVLGADSKLVKDVCDQHSSTGAFVTVANYNCPGQVVICGDEDAVATVEGMLKEQGVKRCVRLNVSGPFHTKVMKSAGEKLAAYFENLNFQKPQIPVVMNVTGNYLQAEENLSQLLVKQVQNSVQLEASLQRLLQDGYERFVEIGPGNTLAGFVKKTAKAAGKEIEVISIDTVADYQKLLFGSNE